MSRPTPRRTRGRGFTLIEVMVALAVVALGMSALLETLSISAGNIAALRDKTVAEWVALNKLTDTRLALTPPTLGKTEGDIDDCARGRWHWRQDISAVPAIPGLVNITVSVRRTGNAIARPSTSRAPMQGHLATAQSLGATGPLGSISAVGASGCVAAIEPDGSLGAPSTLGGPGSLDSPTTLGASPQQLGAQSSAPGTLAGPGAGRVLGGGLSSSNSLSSAKTGSDRAAAGSGWLVTLTGFRGNSLAAASGESPDWAGSSFAGTPGANGIPNNGVNNGNGINGGNSGGSLFGPAPGPAPRGLPQ